MHSAFNLFVFPNYMFMLFFFLHERAMCSLEKWHLKITIIIINARGVSRESNRINGGTDKTGCDMNL